MGTTSTRRRTQPASYHYGMEDDDVLYETRMPSSARRYRVRDTADDPAMHKETSGTGRLNRERQVSYLRSGGRALKKRGQGLSGIVRQNPLISLCIGIIIAMLCVMAMNMVTAWWQGYQDNVNYGYPRTSHLEAVVGHNDSISNPTHFIFTNLDCKIQIIEIPGGDPARTRIFQGPTLYGEGCDRIPVTGELQVEDGKHHLIVHLRDQRIVFENDGKTFHPR